MHINISKTVYRISFDKYIYASVTHGGKTTKLKIIVNTNTLFFKCTPQKNNVKRTFNFLLNTGPISAVSEPTPLTVQVIEFTVDIENSNGVCKRVKFLGFFSLGSFLNYNQIVDIWQTQSTIVIFVS